MQTDATSHNIVACCWPTTCADLGKGLEWPRPPIFLKFLQNIYNKNTEMNVQMQFLGPLFPELGSPSFFFNFLHPPLNNIASVCMGLKGLTVRFQIIRNKCQQVPTLLWLHANGRNMLSPTILLVVGQQCCVRLHYRPLAL